MMHFLKFLGKTRNTFPCSVHLISSDVDRLPRKPSSFVQMSLESLDAMTSPPAFLLCARTCVSEVSSHGAPGYAATVPQPQGRHCAACSNSALLAGTPPKDTPVFQYTARSIHTLENKKKNFNYSEIRRVSLSSRQSGLGWQACWCAWCQTGSSRHSWKKL